jgi:hypothetical protein
VPSLTSALTRTDQDGLPIEDLKPEKLDDCDPKTLPVCCCANGGKKAARISTADWIIRR